MKTHIETWWSSNGKPIKMKIVCCGNDTSAKRGEEGKSHDHDS